MLFGEARGVNKASDLRQHTNDGQSSDKQAGHAKIGTKQGRKRPRAGKIRPENELTNAGQKRPRAAEIGP